MNKHPMKTPYHKPSRISLTITILGATWFLLSTIASIMIGKGILNELFPPMVQEQTMDYGPYDGRKLIETPRHIALFRIDGVITSSGSTNSEWVQTFCREIEKAGDNPDVAGILIQINSPGGEVVTSDLIYNAVSRTAKQKPVVAYLERKAASGGYYIACAANTIVTHPLSFTGSIGVIIQCNNYSEAFGKIGLAKHTFKSGKLKDMLNGARPLNEVEEQYAQQLVDRCYDRFLEVVAKSRNLDPAELRREAADGRIILGQDAVRYQLADRSGELRDAIDLIRQQAKAGECNIRRYQIHASARMSILPLRGGSSTHLNLQILPDATLQSSSGEPWAIPSGVPLMLNHSSF